MTRRKICIVTGTRAEYGLLYLLMKKIQADDDLELQLVVTGMHLSPEFGLTYQIIEQDGFCINEKVEMLLASDTPVGIAKSMGLGSISFAEVLDRLTPDVLVVLGDRYEILAAAQAAAIARVPIAHIGGGERTEGLIDECIRHAVSKMSLFHFTSTEEYRLRVIQLGEEPDRVFNVGALGIDNIKKLNLLSREEFESSIGLHLSEQSFLVTYHPVTLSAVSSSVVVSQLLKALDSYPEAKVIFTQANADTDGRIINQMLEDYVGKNSDRMVMIKSLGQIRYLSALKFVDAVIGNSSSGLIEVPSFFKPTINIGARQNGRVKGASVIDCMENRVAIKNAIDQGLSPDFLAKIKNFTNPYGDGETAGRIVHQLKTIDLSAKKVMKKFYDVEFAL